MQIPSQQHQQAAGWRGARQGTSRPEKRDASTSAWAADYIIGLGGRPELQLGPSEQYWKHESLSLVLSVHLVTICWGILCGVT